MTHHETTNSSNEQLSGVNELTTLYTSLCNYLFSSKLHGRLKKEHSADAHYTILSGIEINDYFSHGLIGFTYDDGKPELRKLGTLLKKCEAAIMIKELESGSEVLLYNPQLVRRDGSMMELAFPHTDSTEQATIVASESLVIIEEPLSHPLIEKTQQALTDRQFAL